MKRCSLILASAAATFACGSSSQAASFNSNNPLAAPASGDVLLFIDDLGGTADNQFVAINTGVTMFAGRTYEITAATGHGNGEVLANQSVQMWSTATTGVDAIAPRDFVGQSHSGQGTWLNAPEGEWVDNSFQAAAGVDENFEELIILVTNFTFGNNTPGDEGIAYWDNFRVTEDGNTVFTSDFEIGLNSGQVAPVSDANWTSEATASGLTTGVPEPTAVALFAVGGLLALSIGRRRTE